MDLTASTDPKLAAMEREIKDLVGGPIVRGMNGFARTEIYLARSWLLAIHSYVRRQQGDAKHADRVAGDQVQLLVAIANRLDLDVEQLLAAEPAAELTLILGGLQELDAGTR